ncbi:GM23949 [Drosophila sechellia]|uniref:GM23949 n=1 Tax=Drosophila sechellia TaxID=7238 RepID=B4HI19_DROSE|nr:GM23949 [Drosophila sechellia]
MQDADAEKEEESEASMDSSMTKDPELCALEFCMSRQPPQIVKGYTRSHHHHHHINLPNCPDPCTKLPATRAGQVPLLALIKCGDNKEKSLSGDKAGHDAGH